MSRKILCELPRRALNFGHSVLCVADFYLQPGHDAQAVKQGLAEFVAGLAIRGKEALRAMNVRFAHAPYAEVGPG